MIEVKNLSKKFEIQNSSGKHVLHALSEVSFCLAEGESLAVIGESGSGKTTLAKILSQLYSQDEGKVLFRSEQVHGIKSVCKYVSYVFQNAYSSFDDKYTIGNFLMESMSMCALSKEEKIARISYYLPEVELEQELLDRYPQELSGGQKQRVALLAALCKGVSYIILDEPTSALDKITASQIVVLLSKLKQEKKLIYVFVTHDIFLTKKLCEKVLVLNKGKVEFFGGFDDLLSTPKSEYIQKLLVASKDKLL